MQIYVISYQRQFSLISGKANSISVIRMCEALSKEGNKVVLFCKGNNIDKEDVFNHFGVESEFKIEFINPPQINFFGTIFYSLLLFLRIFSMERPDLFYGRSVFHLAICIFFNQPIAYESHKIPFNYINKICESVLIKTRNFKKLILISEALRQAYLEKFDISETSTLVIHDGAKDINLELNKNRISPNSNNLEDLKVGYVGSLYKGRGIELIMSLSEKLNSTRFYVIGGSQKEVKNFKKDIKSKNLFFCGSVKPKEATNYMQLFDILIAPYQKNLTISNKSNTDTSLWMSPLKIFEYMGSGVPIICSDFPVLREVLDDGRNCLLVKPDNLEEWIHSIRYLASNPAVRISLSKEALNDLKKKYTWDIRASILMGEFSSIIGEGKF